MSTVTDRITMEALELPRESRANLAYQLLLSLEEVKEEPPDVLDSWIKEINRRATELAEGKTEAIPAEDVLREIREEIG